MAGYLDNGRMSIGGMLRYAWRRSLGSISLVIVWICVALFLGVTVLDLLGIVARREAVSVLGLSYVGLFQHKFLFELATAPLLHANLTHLLFNMLALWMLGPDVELRLGRTRYILFSVLCAVTGMIGFLLFNWHTGHVAIGYSGVIFGILVAQAIFFPNNVIAIFAFFPLKMKYAVLLLGAVELYLTISPEGGGVAHAAHLLGAAGAFAYLRITLWWAIRKAQTAVPHLPVMPPKWRSIRKRADVPKEL